jgi:hypothetical protein
MSLLQTRAFYWAVYNVTDADRRNWLSTHEACLRQFLLSSSSSSSSISTCIPPLSDRYINWPTVASIPIILRFILKVTTSLERFSFIFENGENQWHIEARAPYPIFGALCCTSSIRRCVWSKCKSVNQLMCKIMWGFFFKLVRSRFQWIRSPSGCSCTVKLLASEVPIKSLLSVIPEKKFRAHKLASWSAKKFGCRWKIEIF